MTLTQRSTIYVIDIKLGSFHQLITSYEKKLVSPLNDDIYRNTPTYSYNDMGILISEGIQNSLDF